MGVIGKSINRVDAFDKVTGRAKYTDDLCDKNALIAKIVPSTIAHGYVKKIHCEKALELEGVIKIFTCFDVPEHRYLTPGHPYSLNPEFRDKPDRYLLNKHVRFYGDEIAVVVARDEVAAKRAVGLIEAEYEELPCVLNLDDAMKDSAPLIHEGIQNNILGHSTVHSGDCQKAITTDPDLIKVEGWYETPVVQHCHLENHVCYAYMEGGKIVVVTSTQLPHILRRLIAQALDISWGKVRVIKPYVGGGFGNKQEALYEPLCAYLTTQLNGQTVKIESTREETFINHRVRHSIKYHITSYVKPDGKIVARKMEGYSDQGGYSSHGHVVLANSPTVFGITYPCKNLESEIFTVYTNKPAAGAMRGYGVPQITFANECNVEEICRILKIDPVEYRMQNATPKGFIDSIYSNEMFQESFKQCLEKGKQAIDYDSKKEAYKNQTGPIRRGVGVAIFWYYANVWPISLETSACRMTLNQDGSMQLQLGEVEIGQGADTAFTQMAAEVVGIPVEKIYITSTQDTDVSPFGLGAYASRQTFIGAFSIQQTGLQFKKKILEYAQNMTRMPVDILDLVDGKIIRTIDQRVILTIEDLALTALYNMADSRHISAETTANVKTNANSVGCSFAEVEVNIPLCKVNLLNLINVHDCGRLINPAMAEAQVHGGMSMGIGYALSEKMLFDEKTCKPLNNNFLDYKISTFKDHPELQALFIENAEPTNPFGVKSLGEPPTCSPAPAIRNAVYAATGIAFNEIPITPQLMYREFLKNGLISS